MHFMRTMLSAFLSLAILAALAFGAYAVLAWTGDALTQLAPQLTTSAVLAALVAAWLVVGTVSRARQRRAAERLHAERAATYQFFADVWAAVVAGAGENLDAERRALDRLMALYAGAGALKAHVALRTLERERGVADPAVRIQLARALLEMRRDLGLETRGLAAEELGMLFDSDQRPEPVATIGAPSVPAIPQPPTVNDLRPRVSLTPDV